ncbi:substance-P receptor-like [Ptychodera flava]|uniref:substance-P receptor-like n=1 Tax=Ptychodera flava TaxID=63121 RepID=UPI00396A4392
MENFVLGDDIRAWIESVTNNDSNLTASLIQEIYDYYDSDPVTERPLPDASISMDLPTKYQIIFIIAFTLNMILSILGNLVVIFVLSCGRRPHTNLTASLVNLAISDLAMAIFCMPFTFPTLMFGRWVFGSEMCYIVIFMQHASVIVSIGTLTAVGIDRYSAVMNPMKARFTKGGRKIFITFVIIWFSAIAVSSVQVVFTRVRTSSRSLNGQPIFFCSEWYPSKTFSKYWEISVLVATYFVPLSVLSYTYTRVGVRLWGRHCPGNANQQRDVNQRRSKQKVIKMLVIIVVMFALCWLPLHVFKLIGLYNPYLYDSIDTDSQDRMRIINACVLWLAMSNSFVNPIIYGIYNDNFKTDFKRFFKSCAQTNRSLSVRSTTSRISGRSLYSTSSRSTPSKLSLQRDKLNVQSV